MKALLYDDNGAVIASRGINPVNMYAGDTLTVKWELVFDDNLTCSFCGKQIRAEGESKLIEMSEVNGAYYHLCGKRCRFLKALKGKEK